MSKRTIKLVFPRGAYVRLSGSWYGHFDGEVGRVCGQAEPFRGLPTYTVCVRGTLITALARDLQAVKPRAGRRIPRVGEAADL